MEIKPYHFLVTIYYWLPLSFCIISFTIITIRNYIEDREKREIKDPFYYYNPTDTLGDLICRIILTTLPIINIITALCLLPGMFVDFFEWIRDIFDTPLVPPKRSIKDDTM